MFRNIWCYPHTQTALWFLPAEGKGWERWWSSIDSAIKSRLGCEEGIDREIMRNKPATVDFFILHLISSLNVYVMSYFCHSHFTRMKTEAWIKWPGSFSVLGLDTGTPRPVSCPSLKVCGPRSGREWHLSGGVNVTQLYGPVSPGLHGTLPYPPQDQQVTSGLQAAFPFNY